MADGRVVIDVILDDGQVAKGIINIDKKLGSIAGAGKRAAAGVKEIATAVGLVAVASKAINAVKNSIDSAIARYDTLKGFPVVMQQMGFSAEQSKKSIDKLASGIDGLPTTLDSIVSSTKRIALLTGDLDKATDTALALNNAFLASGSSAADAERGLTQYVQMLSKGKVDMQSWMTLQETMGYALRETAKEFGYTGASATNNLYKALQSGTITFDQFNAKLIELSNKTGGFAEVAKSSTSGIATSFSNMKNAVTRGVANVIDAIDQALGGTGSIAGYLDKLKVGINAAFNGIVKVIPIVADGLRTIGSLFSPLIPIVQNFGEQIKSALSDKAGQAITFIQNAISNIKSFWEQNGQSILTTATTIFSGIWNTVSTAFNAVYSIISSVLGSQVIPFVQEQLASIKQFWDQNGQQIMQAVQNCFQFIQTVIGVAMPVIKFIISTVWSAIKDIIGGALDVIKGLIQVFTAIFTGDWSQLWEGIKKIIKGAINLILGIMSLQFLGGIKTAFMNLLKSGVSIVKNMWTQIINFFKNLRTNAENIAMQLVSKVVSYFRNLFNQAKNIFGMLRTFGASIWNALKQAILGVVRNILNGVKQSFSNMLSVVRNLSHNIKSTITSIWKNIINYLKNINLVKVGKNIIQGLIKGIGSMASAVVDKVKNIGNSITSGLKKVLKIKSPSRLMRDEVGKWIPAGIAVGIEENEKSALNSTKSMAKKLTNEAQLDVVNRLRNVKLSLGNVVPTPTLVSGYGTIQTVTPEVNNNFTLQGDVILDGRKIGDVIWEPVNERIEQNNRIKEKFKKG